MKGLRTYVITLIEVLGAFNKPNGITSHLHRPSFVLKAVFHSSPKRILIWWYPLFKLIFKKNVALDIISNISFNLGIGKRYFIVILLIAWPSTHILQDPPFFGVKSARTAHGLKLSCTNPFSKSSSTFLAILSCWGWMILYWGKFGSATLGTRSMAC